MRFGEADNEQIFTDDENDWRSQLLFRDGSPFSVYFQTSRTARRTSHDVKTSHLFTKDPFYKGPCKDQKSLVIP